MSNEICELSLSELDAVVGGGDTIPGKNGVSTTTMTNIWNQYEHELSGYMLWNQFFKGPALPDLK